MRQSRRNGRMTRSMTAVAATFAMALAACGGGAAGDSPTATDAAGDQTGGDAEGSSGEGGVVRVGVITALTGSQAVLGEEISQGPMVAAKAINDAGGINGYTFEVFAEDHAVEPETAVSAAQKLISSDEVDAILSSFTGPTLAVRPLAAENDMFVLNGGAIGPDLIGKEALYSTLANGVDLYGDLTTWMVNEYDAQTVGVIYTDESAGIETSKEIETFICPDVGCEVVASEAAPVGTTDFGGQIERVAAANPDLFLTVAYGDDIGYLVRQIRERGIEVPIGIMDWQENAAEIAGDTAAEEVIAVLDRFDPAGDDPEAQEYAELYREEYGEESGRYGANYYEHVRFVIAPLVERITERGEDPTAPGALLAELRDMIEAGEEFETVYGESIVLNADGTVNKPTALYRINESGEAEKFHDIPVE